MRIRLLTLLSITFLSATSALAECIPSEDPCAPKKVIGAWDSSVLFGFNKTKGNSETTLLNVGFKADKEKDSNIYTASGFYNYGEDDNLGDQAADKDTGNTTRNDVRANGRYDRLLTDRTFVGIGTTFLYDELAEIDYRSTLDPGVGYYFLKENSFKFRGEVGPSYLFERVGGIKDDYLAPRIGERFEWAITCTSRFFQSASVIMDVNDSSNYIVNAEAGLEAALSTNLALVFTVREVYDNVPAEGLEKSDLQMITSLKISL